MAVAGDATAVEGSPDSLEGAADTLEADGSPGTLWILENRASDNREGGAFFPVGSCDILLVSESKNLWLLEHR